MDSRRQLKMAQLIKEAFSEVLIRDGKSLYGSAFVTVSNVWVNADMSIVRFYLSIFNTNAPEDVVEKFRENKFEIKQALAEKLRHHLRRIPEIEFFKDDTLDYAFHIEEVFKKIKQEDEALQQEKAAPKKSLPAKKKAAVKPKKT